MQDIDQRDDQPQPRRQRDPVTAKALDGPLVALRHGARGHHPHLLAAQAGGLLGGQSGSAPVGQLLSGIEQVIGGKPGSAQLGANQGSTTDANSPIMSLLGPVASAVAGKAGISPQVATTVAGSMHNQDQKT